MTWKKHPEGPFTATQILGWKNEAELLPIYEKQYGNMVEHALELEHKLEAVKAHLMTWKETHEDWQMGHMTQWKKELDEILED